MQRAIRYLIDSYGLSSVDELYTCLKEEIKSGPEGGNCLYPNPLCAVDCVHISNEDHPNQPVHIDGSLELIADVELYSTCYPKRKFEGIVWSEPLYVELKDLKICPGDSPLCLSHHFELPNNSNNNVNLIVDELDLSNYWSDDERENETTTWKNIKVIPDALCPSGANRVFAYRGFLGITVQQHLYSRHRVTLKYPGLPCVVQFGGGYHRDLFPIELLRVANAEMQSEKR
ncbi:hypothetical protein niasHT_022022 [Heterodera trifolii]|uniref:Uncharacterized protein n=1 Tax=Heterodera trifolii TaxID=157864 RepID=A0ABD2JBG7_9BILA